MSYDLYFLKKPSRGWFSFSRAKKFDTAAFEAYFATRPMYQGDTQVVYQNDDTGVYFIFELSSGDEESAEEESPIENCCATFNINFYRPHFFGLEAVSELESFVRHFEFDIFDPQTSGMGEGPFKAQGFLDGWNAGNRLGYRAILSKPDSSESIATLPTSVLEQTWRWNYARKHVQNVEFQDGFVPKIMFFEGASGPLTAVVWPDACPVLLPVVDFVIILRNELANSGEEEVIEVSWSEIEDVLRPFPALNTPHPHFRLDYEQAPTAIVDRIRSFPITNERRQAIAPDSILNAEWVAEARTKA